VVIKFTAICKKTQLTGYCTASATGQSLQYKKSLIIKPFIMKKNLFFALVALTSVLLLSSCKKDDPTPASTDPAYVGLWKGKYGSGASAYPSSGYSFLFRKDGTVRVFDGADTATAGKAEGTYSISGSIVNTTYKYITGGYQYSTAATMDLKTSFLEGTWGSGTNTTNGGKFFIVKQ
jgi:hypothetical protein